MIYGYIRAGISIPEGIRIPMETLLDANYRSYIKVLEDEVSKTITVYFENGKQTFPFRNEGPMMNDRCNAIKEFVDALQTNSVTEKIVFKGLSTLGTIAEAKELYWYMIQRRVNVEFIDTPIANTARYFGIIERLPYQTQILAFEELDFSYKREIALNELGWYEFTPSSYSSQLSRKQKKVMMTLFKNNDHLIVAEDPSKLIEYCISLLGVDRSTVYRLIKEYKNETM